MKEEKNGAGIAAAVALQRAVDGTEDVEQAMLILTRQLGLRLIDLVPGFQSTARQVNLLHYQLDTHWNRQDRSLAAKLTFGSLPGSAAGTTHVRIRQGPVADAGDAARERSMAAAHRMRRSVESN